MVYAKKKFHPGEAATYEIGVVLKELHKILMDDAHNKYLQSFLGVKEYVEKNLQDKVWDVKLSIHATESAQQLMDQGHLNVPTVDEIASCCQVIISSPRNTRGMFCLAIKVCNNLPYHSIQYFYFSRYVAVNYRQQETTDSLQILPDYHRAYDPLMYPCIFPNSNDGWHCDLPYSCLQHTNNQLMD